MDIHAVAELVPAKVVSLPPEAQQVSSPLQVKVWEAALTGHPNHLWVKLLLDGITSGVYVSVLMGAPFALQVAICYLHQRMWQ